MVLLLHRRTVLQWPYYTNGYLLAWVKNFKVIRCPTFSLPISVACGPWTKNQSAVTIERHLSVPRRARRDSLKRAQWESCSFAAPGKLWLLLILSPTFAGFAQPFCLWCELDHTTPQKPPGRQLRQTDGANQVTLDKSINSHQQPPLPNKTEVVHLRWSLCGNDLLQDRTWSTAQHIVGIH